MCTNLPMATCSHQSSQANSCNYMLGIEVAYASYRFFPLAFSCGSFLVHSSVSFFLFFPVIVLHTSSITSSSLPLPPPPLSLSLSFSACYILLTFFLLYIAHFRYLLSDEVVHGRAVFGADNEDLKKSGYEVTMLSKES